METKHTPGPWSVEKDGLYLIGASGAGNVAYVGTPFVGDAEANARLIAAAPAMLAALQQIVADYDYEKGNCKPHTLAGHAKRAIEQATGE